MGVPLGDHDFCMSALLSQTRTWLLAHLKRQLMPFLGKLISWAWCRQSWRLLPILPQAYFDVCFMQNSLLSFEWGSKFRKSALVGALDATVWGRGVQQHRGAAGFLLVGWTADGQSSVLIGRLEATKARQQLQQRLRATRCGAAKACIGDTEHHHHHHHYHIASPSASPRLS